MLITMFVEIPMGSRNRYEVDHDTGEIFLDRMRVSETRYPAEFGFIPATLAEDGEPLDALALVAEPTFPGCRIRIRPVGVFTLNDHGTPDHKILGVPDGDPRWEATTDISDVSPAVLTELRRLFTASAGLEEVDEAAPGWQPAMAAVAIVAEARRRYS